MLSHAHRLLHRDTIGTLLLVLLALGCESSSGPVIPVHESRFWSLPPSEHKAPAPRAMATHISGTYVLDTAGRIVVFDEQGSVVRHWDMPESDVGKPEDIHVLMDGRIAVADTHYHRVVFFDMAGNLLETWGEYGEGPKQFIYPVALAEDPAGNIYVGEYGGHDRIQKFTSAGELLATFGSFGTGPGQFQRPSGLVWYEGRIYVADAINHQVHVFHDDGSYERALTGQPGSVVLAYPYDIDVTVSGDLVVVEYGAGCVTQLTGSGKLLGRWGTVGTGLTHLATPWGVAVRKDLIFVADTGNRRIVELRL